MGRLGKVGAVVLLLWHSPGWAADVAGRVSLASRQLGGVGAGSGDHPIRAVVVGLALGLAIALACRWVRRSHPAEGSELGRP